MAYRSRVEAYSHCILVLSQLKLKYQHKQNQLALINVCIDQIKIAMENHEQKASVVIGYLNNLTSLDSIDQKIVSSLRLAMEESTFEQTAQAKFENPLARRAESELAIALLTKPTSAMMVSVGRVSAEIIKLIDDLQCIEREVEVTFLQGEINKYFKEKSHLQDLRKTHQNGWIL